MVIKMNIIYFSILLDCISIIHALPSKVNPDKVFIAVKTTAKFHNSRLKPVIETWYQTAPKSTFFFTDAQDDGLEQFAVSISGQSPFVTTSCPPDHSRTALSCKLEAELAHFLAAVGAGKDWFCHVDDDNYLNTPALLKSLARYPASQPWYLGKVSISKKLEILDRLQLPEKKSASFWFATGGAGFCLSRALAEKMRPFVENEKFQELANTIRLPDDVTLGYLIEVLLNIPLTQVSSFHSHLEPLRKIKDLSSQITFSYSNFEDTLEKNVVEFEDENEIDVESDDDPTRFYKIHCKLFNQC